MGSRFELDGVCPLQRRLVGHGIGPLFRTGLQVLQHYDPSRTRLMRPGMVFTMEPMINAGRRDIRQKNDGWSIVTKDHSLSAQYEHTILVTDSGFEVLTVSDGCPPPP